MFQSFAAIVTRLTGFANGVTQFVESGEPIRVFGYTVANVSTGTIQVQVTDADENVIESILVPANTTIVVNIPFIADKGLGFLRAAGTASNLRVTVKHSHPGS